MSESKLLSWYSQLYPFRLDLVGDYAGSSRFLIHGDSLLRHCFSDERIEFSDGSFQLLHAVYVVEQFLQGFVRRKCVFDIVFLDSDARMCVPAEGGLNAAKWLCAREIVIRHLLGVEGGEWQIREFPEIYDRAFLSWIAQRRPLFVLAADGSDSILIAQDSDSSEAEGHEDGEGDHEDEEDDYEDGEDDGGDQDDEYHEGAEPGIGVDIERRMKAMISMFMGMGYNIALLSRVEFVDSKIFAYVIDCSVGSLHTTHEPTNTPPRPVSHFELPRADDIPSARERLTVFALICLLKSSGKETITSSEVELASAFLLHTAFLNQLSLSARQWKAWPGFGTSTTSQVRMRLDRFLSRIAECAMELLCSGGPELNLAGDTDDLCDFVDGNLVLRVLCGHGDCVTAEVNAIFVRLSNAVLAGLPTVKECLFCIPSDITTIGDDSVKPPVVTPLLPFSNPIFDPHLRSIKLEVDEKFAGSSAQVKGTVYEEKSHWHNSKKPLSHGLPNNKKLAQTISRNVTGKGQPDNWWAKWKMGSARKYEQRYLNQMQRYAASLTDSADGILNNQKLIICDAGEGQKRRAGKENIALNASGSSKKGKGSKAGGNNPVISKADKIRIENAEKTALKEAKSLTATWKNIFEDLEASQDDEGCLSRLDTHMKKIQKALPRDVSEKHEGRFIELEVRAYKIRILQKMWIGSLNEGQKERGYAVVAALFDEARKVLLSPVLTVKVKEIMTNLFAGLGIVMPPATAPKLVARDLSFKTKWNGTNGSDFSLGMSSEEFQLQHFGPYMDRNMDSKPDDRVPFEPDGWQRKVLDEIDSENSVFVVAPTSAGKTFISFHAMEKVLKANDDGILAYVAPTKALVNQIAAEVISRFRKNYKQTGKTVWAIHTRDYRVHDPNNCQILVTVPHILSIMLLSPSNAEKWSPRVKRIIFDEVHSIGNADDGVVWEQLLLIAPCPIIALSATVGNPEEFNDWLQTTQRSMGFRLSMIQHPYRYSDLRKYMHRRPNKSQASQVFRGLGKVEKFGHVDGVLGLDAIHPISSLVDASQEIPNDLALEPRDCFSLYQCMKEVQTKPHPVPDHLDYRRVFGKNGAVIKKADVIVWEAGLKLVLKDWMADKSSPFQRLRKKVEIPRTCQSLEDTPGNFVQKADSGDSCRRWGTLALLGALHSENALPAILFAYDRALCERICMSLCMQLREGEKEWRSKDPGWLATMEEYEAWQKKCASRGANKFKPVMTAENKTDAMMQAAEREHDRFESFNPADPSPGFTFADTKKCSKAEFLEEISYLDPSPFVAALRRGVGIHHAGMNRKYRQAVETLFRKGYLRVVIATGTLALGINMPCKTVIFAGDSVYLTPLNYRQAAGRAGRRGFDLLGNVIFHNMQESKAQRLISSRLPSLLGHFPISTSLVLRLFILLHNSKQSVHAQKCINSLLTQPRLVIGADSFKEQMLHHLRFSIEFLRQQELLGPDGSPLNFAGLASHLYYTEGSAFSLHALLCSGYFKKLCKGISDPRKQCRICLQLVLTMSHIFSRVPPRGKRGRLPPLPDGAREILLEYNKTTLKTYSAYVEIFARQYCQTPDKTLPFSRRRCGGTGGHHDHSIASNAARSSFVALSSHVRDFTSIPNLLASVRSDIFLEGGSVPHLPVTAGKNLNSYLYSFYKDGDAPKLQRDNGIRTADVWFVLKDFSLILATVIAGLECVLKYGPGAYLEGDDIQDIDEEGEALGMEREGEENEDMWAGGDIEGLKDVLRAFWLVRSGFEEKFKAIFA